MKLKKCPECLDYYPIAEFVSAIDENDNKIQICKYCAEIFYWKCKECNFYVKLENYDLETYLCYSCQMQKLFGIAV